MSNENVKEFQQSDGKGDTVCCEKSQSDFNEINGIQEDLLFKAQTDAEKIAIDNQMDSCTSEDSLDPQIIKTINEYTHGIRKGSDYIKSGIQSVQDQVMEHLVDESITKNHKLKEIVMGHNILIKQFTPESIRKDPKTGYLFDSITLAIYDEQNNVFIDWETGFVYQLIETNGQMTYYTYNPANGMSPEDMKQAGLPVQKIDLWKGRADEVRRISSISPARMEYMKVLNKLNNNIERCYYMSLSYRILKNIINVFILIPSAIIQIDQYIKGVKYSPLVNAMSAIAFIFGTIQTWTEPASKETTYCAAELKFKKLKIQLQDGNNAFDDYDKRKIHFISTIETEIIETDSKIKGLGNEID